MKNILVFNHHSFPLSATFIFRQIQGAVKENKIFLASLKYSHGESFPLPGVEKITMKPFYGWPDRIFFFIQRRFFCSGGLSWLAMRKLRRIVESKNIQIIHVHYGTWAVHLLPVLKKMNMPLIVSFHGYDASQALNKKEYRAALPALFDLAKGIILVSEHMRESLKLKAWENRVSLIPYGIDINLFRASGAVRNHSEIKILHSGRLTPKKGVSDLITVFSSLVTKYANISLHILGEGAEKDNCQQLVKGYNLSGSVHFYGPRPLPDVIRLMNDCHIFVLNSRTAENGDMEGLPNSILEAMSMEMAVVSTFHAGIPSVIEHEVSGLLVPERDNLALALALEKLIDNRTLIHTLGIHARQRIEKHFTVEVMHQKLNTLYSAVN